MLFYSVASEKPKNNPSRKKGVHRTDTIDATAIHANLADGVLTVHLPKKTDGGPRRIPVVLAG